MRLQPTALTVVFLGLAFAALPAAAQKAPAPAASAYCGDVNLDQSWSCEQREDFWFRTQGSHMLPYTWFLNLEQAESNTPFVDPAHMDALRFMLAPKSSHNPDGLPVGFTKDPEGCTGSDCWAGLTCAACHTAQIDFNQQHLLVDGGPGMLDFSRFLGELIAALKATAENQDKFDRFAKKVAGEGSTPAQRDQLFMQLRWRTGDLLQRAQMNQSVYPYGFSRVDAFGAILNQVLVHDLDIGENVVRADAPVSFPCLWDTPQHDKVQWNGAGASGILSITRNIGEVLGVFGTVDVAPRRLLPPVYRSSIGPNLGNLKHLEDSLRQLTSPVWPRIFPAIDSDKAATGKRIYDQQCVRCHAYIDRKDPSRHVKAQMTPLGEVQTDPAMAQNFANRTGRTGRLQGTFMGPLKPLGIFGPVASGEDILGNVITGTAASFLLPQAKSVAAPTDNRTKAFLAPSTLAYKARPLNGVWATAPYLHNGSVRNLWQLLQPSRESTFRLGDRTFDPVNVGFVSAGDFVFDTTPPGNHNTGHTWGTNLPDDQKWALIEFLKTL